MIPSEYLINIKLFENLHADIIQKIAISGNEHFFKKNTVILLEEDFGTTLFFIKSGKVKVTRSSDDGREVILNLLNKNDFFGEMSILDGLNRSATVIAVEDSVVFMLKRNDFLSFLKKYPEIAIGLVKTITKRLRSANLQIKSLSLNDAEGKIATVLLQLALDIGKFNEKGVTINNLPIQQTIASMASTSRETVSRILNNFSKKEIIELEGSELKIIDFEQFRSNFT